MEYLYTKISIMTNIKIFEWDCETDAISCYGVLAEQSTDIIRRTSRTSEKSNHEPENTGDLSG